MRTVGGRLRFNDLAERRPLANYVKSANENASLLGRMASHHKIHVQQDPQNVTLCGDGGFAGAVYMRLHGIRVGSQPNGWCASQKLREDAVTHGGKAPRDCGNTLEGRGSHRRNVTDGHQHPPEAGGSERTLP